MHEFAQSLQSYCSQTLVPDVFFSTPYTILTACYILINKRNPSKMGQYVLVKIPWNTHVCTVYIIGLHVETVRLIIGYGDILSCNRFRPSLPYLMGHLIPSVLKSCLYFKSWITYLCELHPNTFILYIFPYDFETLLLIIRMLDVHPSFLRQMSLAFHFLVQKFPN